MATSLTTSLPLWLAGGTYDADAGNDLRNSHITATFLDTGIMSGSTIGVRGGVTGGAGLAVGASSGMNVSVQPGSFVVPNTATPVAGGYSATLAQSGTLTVLTADPSNPRIDIVVASVTDNGSSTSSGQVQIITGTAAASPAPPAPPANSITLAQIAVPALAASITAGNITDTRPFTTTAGGVLVASKGSVTGYPGMAAYDKASGAFYHNTSASGSKQFKVLPFAPVMVTRTTAYLYPTSPTTIMSANVTVDGNTDLKITVHTTAIAPYASSAVTLGHLIKIGNTVVDEHDLRIVAAPVSELGDAFTWVTYTLGATRPAAGTVSVAVTGQTSGGGGGYPQIRGSSASPYTAWMRIEPVVL